MPHTPPRPPPKAPPHLPLKSFSYLPLLFFEVFVIGFKAEKKHSYRVIEPLNYVNFALLLWGKLFEKVFPFILHF
jgi:hypothetical protein